MSTNPPTGFRGRNPRNTSPLLPLVMGIALLTSSMAWGQLDEGSTQSPEGPKPRFPQLPGDTPGDQVKPRTDSPVDSDIKPNESVGRIQKISGRKVSVKQNDEAAVEVFTIAPSAEITLNRKPAELADLQVQDFVRITKMNGKPDLAVTVAAARVVKDTPPQDPPVRTVRPDRTRRAPLPDRQGGLGLVVSDSPNEGVLILDVNEGTPAQSAGIRTGDFLLELASKKVVTPDDFLTAVRSHAPNEKVNVLVWREGKTRKGTVELTTHEDARDREAEDGRALILAETHGDDAVVIKRTPGRTERLDEEPEAVILDREEDGSKIIVERETKRPAEPDDLAREYRRLQERVLELEKELERLKQ